MSMFEDYMKAGMDYSGDPLENLRKEANHPQSSQETRDHARAALNRVLLKRGLPAEEFSSELVIVIK